MYTYSFNLKQCQLDHRFCFLGFYIEFFQSFCYSGLSIKKPKANTYQDWPLKDLVSCTFEKFTRLLIVLNFSTYKFELAGFQGLKNEKKRYPILELCLKQESLKL